MQNKSNKKVLMGAQENKFQISFGEIWSFWSFFSRAPMTTFSLELFYITYYINL